MNIPTPQQVADSIIAEIKTRPELMLCSTFSELHDHCDANCLGISESLLEIMPLSDAIDILNPAQEIVNDFLFSRSDYTVFCIDADGLGTTWIGTVKATDAEEAAQAAKAECAEDWQQDESTIHVLGIATGDIEIVEWNDLDN